MLVRHYFFLEKGSEFEMKYLTYIYFIFPLNAPFENKIKKCIFMKSWKIILRDSLRYSLFFFYFFMEKISLNGSEKKIPQKIKNYS